MRVHVGVDVGGTNTDAVVLCGQEVVGWAKHVTTEDVTSGVTSAIHAALTQAASNCHESLEVLRVHIGTTHFVNAVIQKRHLVRVSIIRLCGTATTSVPPYCDFPPDLHQVIGGPVFMVSGGFEFDGQTEISPVNESEIQSIIQDLKSQGVGNVVIAGTFSPVNNSQELKVAEIFRSEYPGASLTLSHQIGYIGTLERENASALNESLKPLCRHTVGAFRAALDRLGLTCPFFLTQNDGTLISAEQTLEQPVLTFASGPTNSMRGAAFLSGVSDAVVVDIGGTTTDVGVLVKGFPKQAPAKVKIGKVKTNFQMPDVLSIGLGGGSHVHSLEDGQVRVGPQSVGYRLTKEALVFGGHTVTASDVAVAHSLVEMGDKPCTDSLPVTLVQAAVDRIHDMVESAIDQVKMSKAAVPVILVGGGSVLLSDAKQLKGTTTAIKPKHFDVANAVGAALSQVSGSVDYVVSLECKTRDQAIMEAKVKATGEAVKAGADPTTIQVVDIMEVPLNYVPGNVTRVTVRVVGDLILDGASQTGVSWKPQEHHIENTTNMVQGVKQTHSVTGQSLEPGGDFLNDVSCLEKEPDINPETGVWSLSEWDIECLAVGAGILGCGGGGSPNIGRIRCLRALASGKKIQVMTPERFCKDDRREGLVIPMAFMGAPTIWNERPPNGHEPFHITESIQNLFEVYGYQDGKLKHTDGLKIEEKNGVTFIDNFEKSKLKNKCETERKMTEKVKIAATLVWEIGGCNSTEALLGSAHTGLPVLDCDLMGRAYPELQMTTNFMYGMAPYPAMLASHNGREMALLYAPSPKHLEDHFRAICVDMGCAGAFTIPPFTKQQALTMTIPHSISRAWRLGHAVLLARKHRVSPIEAILKHEGGKILIQGKIDDVERRTLGGFTRGTLQVEGVGEYTGHTLHINFQNENLVAKLSSSGEQQQKSKVLACTPDLISIVEVDSGEPIPTEEVRYGLRVAVIAMPVPPILRTPEVLAFVGPQAFGYPEDEVHYEPFGIYMDHAPVPPTS